MRKESILKGIRGICYFLLAVIFCWAVIVVLQVLTWTGITDIKTNINFQGAYLGPITWFSDAKGLTVQLIVAIGYCLATIVLLYEVTTFLLSCLKNISMGRIFSRKNVSRLWVMTIANFLNDIFSTNLSVLAGFRELSYSSGMIMSFINMLFITLLYSVAVIASEENELTI